MVDINYLKTESATSTRNKYFSQSRGLSTMETFLRKDENSQIKPITQKIEATSITYEPNKVIVSYNLDKFRLSVLRKFKFVSNLMENLIGIGIQFSNYREDNINLKSITRDMIIYLQAKYELPQSSQESHLLSSIKGRELTQYLPSFYLQKGFYLPHFFTDSTIVLEFDSSLSNVNNNNFALECEIFQLNIPNMEFAVLQTACCELKDLQKKAVFVTEIISKSSLINKISIPTNDGDKFILLQNIEEKIITSNEPLYRYRMYDLPSNIDETCILGDALPLIRFNFNVNENENNHLIVLNANIIRVVEGFSGILFQ